MTDKEDHERPVPLHGDRRRQAHESLGGLVYQAYVSIEGWLRLKSAEEVIYLEGAEDFDAVGQAEATAVQVKRTSAPISLGTAATLKALSNFWRLQLIEKPRSIDLHYLTTAEVAKEKDVDFDGVSGIVAWELARTNEKLAKRVAEYVANRLPDADLLSQFLKHSKTADVQEQVFRRFHWFHSQRNLEGVEARVLNQVQVLLGERGGSISLAEHAVNRLLRRFFSTVVQKDEASRILTYGALLSELEEARTVTVRVDRPFLSDNLPMREAPLTGASIADQMRDAREDATVGSEALREWETKIGGVPIERPELEALVQRISEHPTGRTLLVGEAGSGKSALLSNLAYRLEELGVVVFAIKADLIASSVRSIEELSHSLGFKGRVQDEIALLASEGPVVLLLDQLDAVSEVMDTSSWRMKILLRLVKDLPSFERTPAGTRKGVHVVVSSREFEASFDARFQALEAETYRLELPSFELVASLLSTLAIEPASVPVELRETLRRPFALKLFVDIMRREVPATGLLGGELLSTWIRTADFGDRTSRDRVTQFLTTLAADMTEAEMLWRPADLYDLPFGEAVNVALASGLVIRSENSLGFSHQSWLDDFQAKTFSTSRSLADYAVARQDGLFARATVLRGLQRLRANDRVAYEVAIDRLLGDSFVRRHLRHLTCDFLASQTAPLPRERTWIQKILQADVPLARRAVGLVSLNWAPWRSSICSSIPQLMSKPDLAWSGANLLKVEAAIHPDRVVEWIATEWAAAENDNLAVNVLSSASVWTPAARVLLSHIFSRSSIDVAQLRGYFDSLCASETAELLSIFLEGQQGLDRSPAILRGLGKHTAKEPMAFVKVLFPWFLRLAQAQVGERAAGQNTYPRSQSLPSRFRQYDPGDSPISILRACLKSCMEAGQAEALALCMQACVVEVDEVQALIAEALTAGVKAFTAEAVEFLLDDPRRFQLSTSIEQDSQRVSRLVDGSISQRLLRAILPLLSNSQRLELLEGVEQWHVCLDVDWLLLDVRVRLHKHIVNDSARFPLLAEFSASDLSSRRLRQLREWRAREPGFPLPKKRPDIPVPWRSSMSADQMERADDEKVYAMLDVLHDSVEPVSLGRRWTPGAADDLHSKFCVFANK